MKAALVRKQQEEKKVGYEDKKAMLVRKKRRKKRKEEEIKARLCYITERKVGGGKERKEKRSEHTVD